MIHKLLAVAAVVATLPASALAQKDPPVPDTVTFEKNIEYTTRRDLNLQLNMARPKTGDGPFPTVLFIHGGGFRAGNREGYNAQIIRMAEKGCKPMVE